MAVRCHNGRDIENPMHRSGEVFARVSEFQVDPERLDEMSREGVEHVLPALEMQSGFNGGLVLADRRRGRVLAVTLWESEQAMHTTEEAAYWLRSFGAEAGGGIPKDVERYEVFLAELP
jgi:hypothetical protein